MTPKKEKLKTHNRLIRGIPERNDKKVRVEAGRKTGGNINSMMLEIIEEWQKGIKP